jgi:hypothetical protein
VAYAAAVIFAGTPVYVGAMVSPAVVIYPGTVPYADALHRHYHLHGGPSSTRGMVVYAGNHGLAAAVA